MVLAALVDSGAEHNQSPPCYTAIATNGVVEETVLVAKRPSDRLTADSLAAEGVGLALVARKGGSGPPAAGTKLD